MSSLFPTTSQGTSSGAELVTSDGRSLSLTASTLTAHAHGGIARLVLEQRFENVHDDTLRVTYRMPLPADGAVSGYAFDLGERTVTGVVDRKARARERFEQAIASGRTAALLDQERADIFTQRIGNIPPRQAVVARITIDQRLVWLPEGEWELRFPTVIGPRYISASDRSEDVRATHIKVTDRPLAVQVQIEVTIDDAITGGRKASSPSHGLVRRADGVVELQPGARLDRDIVVRWPVTAPDVGLALEAARPTQGDDAFGLLTIVPPSRDAKVAPVARDLIVLLDTSGSMGGGPLDKAKQVVAMLIDSLGAQDRFELIEFSSRPSRFRGAPEEATAAAKRDAIKWVHARRASGGTEMRAAVIEALRTLRIGAQRQVVVVTDGYIGGEHQILEVLHDRLPPSCRLHVLGVGSAVNRSLATSLARAGRGAEVVIGLDEDAERGAKRLLDRTRMPMLTNVEISGSALRHHAPAQVPDVFEGAPLVAALALAAEGGELVVRGQLATDTWEQRIRVPARRPGQGSQAICALYARERVADLEARSTLDEVQAEIEATGLRFSIATRFTSWVAIDEIRREVGPTRDELVPQELPYGTRASSFGLRAAGPLFARQAFEDLGAEAGFDAEEATGTGGAGYLAEDDSLDMPPPRSAGRSRALGRSAPPAPGSAPRGAGRPSALGAPPAPPSGPPSAVTSRDDAKLEVSELADREPTDESAAYVEDHRAARAPSPSPSVLMGAAPREESRSEPDRLVKQAMKPSPAQPQMAASNVQAEPTRKAGPASRRTQRLLAWYSVAFYLAVIVLLLWWLLG